MYTTEVISPIILHRCLEVKGELSNGSEVLFLALTEAILTYGAVSLVIQVGKFQ